MKKALNIAIVGTGPAGMYATGFLLEQREFSVRIDLFDRLPTPWGLVRAGVAPDHPEKETRCRPALRLSPGQTQRQFLRQRGDWSRHLCRRTRRTLRWRSSTAWAPQATTNSESKARTSRALLAAREFVAWYNGHPDYRHLNVDLSHSRTIIVGNGNVALDVARMLTLPIDHLRKTDIAQHALECLREQSRE